MEATRSQQYHVSLCFNFSYHCSVLHHDSSFSNDLCIDEHRDYMAHTGNLESRSLADLSGADFVFDDVYAGPSNGINSMGYYWQLSLFR